VLGNAAVFLTIQEFTLKRFTNCLFFLMTLVLSSCGGGGSGGGGEANSVAAAQASTAASTSTSTSISAQGSISDAIPAPASTSNPAPAGTARIIEYYGASSIWGYQSGTGNRVAVPAPAAFAAALPASLQYDVRNEGVSGTSAYQLLTGTDGVHPTWEIQMTKSKATYVIMNYAINDQWKYDIASYKSYLTSLARIAKKHGKQLVLETPQPTRDSYPDSLDLYVQAMKDVASQEQVPVIDQYQYLKEYLNGASVYTICPDGIHPTDEIYIKKGQYAASVFVTLFPQP
jgi:hypothetical protein